MFKLCYNTCAQNALEIEHEKHKANDDKIVANSDSVVGDSCGLTRSLTLASVTADG